jgi:NADPH:quinone reductase
MSFEQGSMHCVNPLTALGLLDRAKQYGAQAVIQTAAASQLGRMIVRLAQEDGVPLINIVRKDDQAKILQDLGAEHVLNSTHPDFEDKLFELTKKLRATVCFEAIGGSMTGLIMSKLPSNSTCILYGALSEQPVS